MTQGNTSPSRRPQRGVHEDAAWRRRRLEALLRQVEKKPSRVLTDRRCLKPRFCAAFLELADGKCLEQPSKALEWARYAVELARRIDDPHLCLKSFGVVVHALITVRRWQQAAEILEDIRIPALACCDACAGDWQRRQADLKVETFDPEGAQEAVAAALGHGGEDPDGDLSGRIRFLRGIAHFQDGQRGRALEDAGEALLELPLDTPRGYFMDTLAFIACFLQYGAERCHYQTARGYLDRFRERLMGLEGWTEVRQRLAWVEGHVRGRLGERKKAVERFDRLFEAFLGSAPAKHALAVMADRAQLLARRASDTDTKAILGMIDKCRKRLRLDRATKKRLRKVKSVVSQEPEKAAATVAAFRFSFLVPVPGLLSETGRLR